MDCRKFHKYLEDYLEDGLDFAGRFGMERHAQQCISCGEELAGAQRLRRMVRELNRVKAPANFESAVLSEIGKRKGHGRYSYFKKFWFYGFESQSLRRLALAGAGLAALAFGFFYLSPYLSRRAAPEIPSAPSPIAQEPAKIKQIENPRPLATPVVARADRRLSSRVRDVAETNQDSSLEQEQIFEQEPDDSDYVELQMIGPDNRPVSFRLPDKSRSHGSQRSQQYFVRNVSH